MTSRSARNASPAVGVSRRDVLVDRHRAILYQVSPLARFRAFTNGTQVVGIVAKTGKRQLVVKKWFASWPVRTSTVTTPFEA